MFDRIARSWELAKACMRVLMEDKSLLVFPLMSGAATVVIVVTLAFPVFGLTRYFGSHGATHTATNVEYVVLFLFYWLQYSIIIFFNTALIEVAMRRMDGNEATVADGLRRAMSLLPTILAYSFIAATVGMLLRLIAERVGFLGRLVVGLIGFAWTVATALVVPVLAAENVGPGEAISRSVELIKKSWGESIIGNIGIGVVFGFLTFVAFIASVILVIAAGATRSPALIALVVTICVLGMATLILAQATLQGIYSAALYRYANGDDATGGIDKQLLASAFKEKV